MYAVDLDTANTINAAAPVHYRPILFGPDLLPALLNDRKTQTRRPIKLPPGPPPVAVEPLGYTDGSRLRHGRGRPLWRATYGDQPARDFASPFAVGDVLWVRETWTYITLAQNEMQPGDRWHTELNCPVRLLYRADGIEIPASWCPSIGMPFWAARLHLRVTNVRAQRVQDITRDECRAEGVFVPEDVPDHPHYLGFRLTWNRFYSHERGLPFETNPWAWVIEFVRIPAVAPARGGAA